MIDLWACTVCGNTNYKENPECIRCNWGKYNTPSDNIEFDEKRSTECAYGWKCPVCGNYNAGEYPEFDVCPLCGWEDDLVQRDDPDYAGGANRLSLNDFKAEWEKKKVGGA